MSAPVSSTAAAAPLPPAAVTVINIPAERPGPVWSQAQGNVDTFCSKIVRPPTLLHSSHPPAAALNLKLVKNFMICPGQWWWYWLWYWWWWWPHGGHQLLCPAQQQLSAWLPGWRVIIVLGCPVTYQCCVGELHCHPSFLFCRSPTTALWLLCTAPCLCLLFVYHETRTWPPGQPGTGRMQVGGHTLYLGPTCHPAQCVVVRGEREEQTCLLQPTVQSFNPKFECMPLNLV